METRHKSSHLLCRPVVVVTYSVSSCRLLQYKYGVLLCCRFESIIILYKQIILNAFFAQKKWDTLEKVSQKDLGKSVSKNLRHYETLCEMLKYDEKQLNWLAR